jgi:DNA-binding MarR family transcriptional regulator
MPEASKDLLADLGDRAQSLERVLEHRTRLGACVLLTQEDSITFPRLRALLGETDGNLGAHMKRLEDEGYVRVRKRFVDRKPVTRYSLTSLGARAVREHLATLAVLLGALDKKQRG